ncbi:Glyoxalase/Bleomycin resistance protein/Dihydroxybiphenyl dioxygenase [Biscogniauxia mediterranea]|nr:Glyoxalase/Bleomycin resistance protein/Dihydroxybiphenyl dioxygenase [Biscogniauxia mediterranea]
MADATTSGKVMSPKFMAHVVLRTGRFKPMVAFYKAFLGAHASYENDFIAFLTYDEEHHRIAIISVPGCEDKVINSAGLEHIAFTFSNLNDLTTAYKQRKALGIVPMWCVNHGPTTSLYYQDPDRNMLETQVDNFDTIEAANEFMSSPEFAENPIGVDFDPEDLIKRLERGDSMEEIKKRPVIGPRGFDSVPERPKPLIKDSYEPIISSA